MSEAAEPGEQTAFGASAPHDAARRSSGRLKGYLLAALSALLWATGGITANWLFTKPSATNAHWPVPPLGLAIDPATLSGARALTAFFVLLTYLLIRDRSALRIGVRDVPFFALFGVVGMAGVHYTYFKTIALTGSPATAILLEYLAPILVLIVSVVFLGHRLTWTLPAGVGLSVLGCALVVGALGGGGLSISPLGIAWGLAAAACFASYSLMGSWASGRYRAYTTLVFGLAAAALFWLIVLGPSQVLAPFSDPRLAVAIGYVAVVSTVIPFSAFLIALDHIPPTNATVTSTIEPFIAGIASYALFSVSLTVLQLLGGALVIAAIAVVQLPEREPAMVLPPQE